MKNCGVLCFKRYFEMVGYDNPELLNKLAEKVEEKGLSIASILQVMNNDELKVEAIKSNILPTCFPLIVLDKRRNHYLLLLQADKVFIKIYDPNLGEVVLFKIFVRLLGWEYYLTLCYNNED